MNQQSSTEIRLDRNTDLNQSIACTNRSIIDGANFILTLQNGNIIVTSGATLRMKDVTIKFSGDHTVIMADDSSTLELENVTWVLDGDYDFARGRLIVDGGLFQIFNRPSRVTVGFDGSLSTFVPSTKFNYRSTQQSIIRNGGILKFSNICFHYGPTNASNSRLNFEHNQSLLWLKSSALMHSTDMSFDDIKIKCSSNVIFCRPTLDAKITFRNMILFAGKKGCHFINCTNLIGLDGSHIKMDLTENSDQLEFQDIETILAAD